MINRGSFFYSCILLLFPLLVLFKAATAQTSIKGIIIQKDTKLPIPFATVIYQKQSQQKGVISDVNGRFEIKESGINSLTVSCMGYKPTIVQIAGTNYVSDIVIELEIQLHEIRAVTVSQKDNPAVRVMRKVLRNKDRNNYHRYDRYSYRCYFKTLIDIKFPEDSVAVDSVTLKRKEKLRKHAGFISECVVLCSRVGGRAESRIVAQRSSGFESPIFAQSLVSMFHNSISFYNNSIPLFELPMANDRSIAEYISPLADGCLSIYNYYLDDTYRSGNDTIFVINFRPRRGTTFNGLVGTLFVSTNGYALKSIVVEPHEKGLIGFRFKQDYDLVMGKWFPVSLDEEVGILQQKIDENINAYPAYIITSVIDSIDYNPPMLRRDINLEAVYIDELSLRRSESIIRSARRDTLTPRELNTYLRLDSLGRKYHFDYYLNLIPKLSQGRVPYYFLDFDLGRFYTYNKHEGSRPGIGLVTNDRVSRHFELGGYIGYGLDDEEYKYGAHALVTLDRYNEVQLRVNFHNDLREVGANIIRNMAQPSVNDYQRKYLGYRFDQCIEQRAEFSFRALRFLKLSASLSMKELKPLYAYRFRGENLTMYHADEMELSARLAFNEVYITMANQRFMNQEGNPTVTFTYNRGVSLFNSSSFCYNKYELSVKLSGYNGRIGQSNLKIDAGYIDRSLPHSLLFTGEGSFNPKFSMVINSSFQTMKPYEFLSSRYVNLFYSHNFGTLLLKTKRFKPQFIAVHSSGWGDLRNAADHELIEFMEKHRIYNESGLVINNIIRLKYFNMFYIGFGVGGFYRWGYYAYNNNQDNLAVKLSIAVSFK